MTLQTNIFGQTYDDAEPCFFPAENGTTVFNRVTHTWHDWASLASLAKEKGHDWQPNEIGIPTLKYQLANWGGQRYGAGIDISDPDVSGPHTEGDVEFFIKGTGDAAQVGFNLDDDPEPDFTMPLDVICTSPFTNEVKMSIHQKLQEHGHPGLPCMTATGLVKKAYQHVDDSVLVET